jgi:hypothetical protein
VSSTSRNAPEEPGRLPVRWPPGASDGAVAEAWGFAQPGGFPGQATELRLRIRLFLRPVLAQ